MRIARALAMAGINSRRKCEAHISAGQVTVNGEIVRDLGRQVDPDNDDIMFRGKQIKFESYVYYVLNKPAGYVTTASDPFAKKTVFDLLPARLVPKTNKPMPSRTRVFPVGRLDKDSTGLILLTNDGELANRLTHPRYEVGKWYEVKLDRAIDPRDRTKLLKGVRLEDGVAKAERIRPLTKRNMQLLLREGKNREVRRIFEALGYEVLSLCRVAFGPILLGRMPSGTGRFLGHSDVKILRQAAGLP
jgi:23S rRNA pseudouridine2605 synthase